MTQQQPLYEFGGSGSSNSSDGVMHIAIANGFPPPMYQPLLQVFTERYRVVSLPPRPMWTDPPPPETMKSWRVLGDDLLAGLQAYDLRDVISLGHSFGGVAATLAAVAEPERFRALILLDPTFLPPLHLLALRLLRPFGIDSRIKMAQVALNRRSQFASREEAFEYWRGKPMTRKWSDEMVQIYTDSLTRPTEDGGYELNWSPQWEARGYRTIYTGIWADVKKLSPNLPVLVIHAEKTIALPPKSVETLRRVLPHADLIQPEKTDHLFPQAMPERIQPIIADWLERKGLF